MKISGIDNNYNRNIYFTSKEIRSSQDWIALREVLTNHSKVNIIHEMVIADTNSLPSFNKKHFLYEDYINLSKREKLIIGLLNKLGKEDKFFRQDISINKDAQRILYLASKTKENLDKQYPQGYKLLGIGNTPAPIVETMQLLGADAVTIPFSRTILKNDGYCDFPYEHIVPDANYDGVNVAYEKYKIKDWENYFKFFGLDKTIKKTLIFTDMVGEGITSQIFKSILKELGFKNNAKFIPLGSQLFGNIKIDYDLGNCFDWCEFKRYAKIPSPKNYFGKTDIIKNPEYLDSLKETFISRLFRCALFDLITKFK